MLYWTYIALCRYSSRLLLICVCVCVCVCVFVLHVYAPKSDGVFRYWIRTLPSQKLHLLWAPFLYIIASSVLDKGGVLIRGDVACAVCAY